VRRNRLTGTLDHCEPPRRCRTNASGHRRTLVNVLRLALEYTVERARDVTHFERAAVWARIASGGASTQTPQLESVALRHPNEAILDPFTSGNTRWSDAPTVRVNCRRARAQRWS